MTLTRQLQNQVNKQSQQGFTLVEVLMAMVILGIGIFAIAALQVQDVVRNTSAKAQTEGYTWAMDQAEQLLAADYNGADLTLGAHTKVSAPYTINWIVKDSSSPPPTTTIPNTKQINMSILWKNNQQVATLDITRKNKSY